MGKAIKQFNMNRDEIVVMTYAVRAEHAGVVPPYRQFGQNIAPSTTARVLFRKRQL